MIQAIAEAVRQDALGIGYNNLNFAYDAETGRPLSGLEILPLDINEDGQVGATERCYESKAAMMEAISQGIYPSPPARALHLVSRGQPQGLASAFLRWVLTEGQQYLEDVGYIRLSQEQLDEGRARLGE